MIRLADRWLGPCVRALPPRYLGDKALYLTFDDGPDPDCTPRVLDLLERLGVPAAFFVVAERAARRRELFEEIVARGHRIGNHSLDHRYRPFFATDSRLSHWVRDAEARLADMLGHPTVGFRSPAGVRTPPLGRVLRDLGLPLVHWKVRFYDTTRGWPRDRAIASLARTPGGSIVLLHDTHRGERQHEFLRTLTEYIAAARAQGFTFANLPQRLDFVLTNR